MIHNHIWKKSNVHGYMQCVSCGTFILESLVNNDYDASGIYTNNYWSHENNRSTLDEQVNNLTWEFDGSSKVDKVLKYVTGGNRALEIGCAPGIMLQKLADRHTMAFGIEVDPKNFPDIKRIANRPNVRLWEGFFPYDFFGLRTEQFDTVVAMDVMEHSDDPEWFVQRCSEMMTPTGTLVVMTPIVQPGVDMPKRMFNTEEHTYVFSLQHIMEIFSSRFQDVTTDSWQPGHEIIIGKNKRI